MTDDFAPRGLARWPIVTAITYAIVGSFPLFLAGASAVRIQEDLGATRSQFGLAAAGYFAFAAIATPFLGRMIDRYGARPGMIGGALGTALASLIIGVVAGNWVVLGIGLGVAGVANSSGQLSGNRVLASDLVRSRQSWGFGAKQASVPFGSFLAGLLVAGVGTAIRWHEIYVAYAVLAAGLALIAPDIRTAAAARARSHIPASERPMLLALGVAGAIVSATGNALAVLVVDSFETAGFSASVAAGVLAYGSGASVAGRLFVGWYVGRRGTDGYAELTAMVLAGATGFAFLMVAGTNPLLLFIGVGLGFAAGYGWPAVIYFVTVGASQAPPATATSFVLTGVFTGGIAGPALFAAIADRAGYSTAWGTAFVATALAAGAVVFSGRRARRATASA